MPCKIERMCRKCLGSDASDFGKRDFEAAGAPKPDFGQLVHAELRA